MPTLNNTDGERMLLQTADRNASCSMPSTIADAARDKTFQDPQCVNYAKYNQDRDAPEMLYGAVFWDLIAGFFFNDFKSEGLVAK